MKRLLLISCLLASACAGPAADVSIGGKAVAVDVAFGLPDATVVPPAKGTVLVPVPGGLGVLPVPAQQLPPTTPVPVTEPPITLPPAAACPDPGPGVFPKDAATPVIVGVPALGSHLVRYTARIVQDGVARTFSGMARHTITAAAALPGGSTTFDIDVTMLGADTTFSWTSVPTQYNPASVSTGQLALRGASGSSGLGYAASLHPATPLTMLAQPAYDAETFSSASTDASTGTVARLDGTVVGHGTVNACGTPIDTWQVRSTLVTSSSNQDVTTTLVTGFATQYGGVPVSQTETYSGTAGGKQVSGTLTWTWSQAPKGAAP